MLRVVVIPVGREILVGRIQEGNAQAIARRLAAIGAQAIRFVVVDDDLEAIAREIERARADGAAAIITTGGLGPTADDQTLAAIADAAGVPLALNAEALAHVEARYADLAARGAVEAPDLTAPRRKMALLPRGALPLPNPVGAAPGVALEAEGVLIVALPGVPAEMEAILDGSVLPLLRRRASGMIYAEDRLVTDERDESRLAEQLMAVMALVPGVYLKSRATRFGPDVTLEVFLSAWGTARDELEAKIQEAKAQLVQRLQTSRPPA